MSDNKQVKALGLRFARALQMTLKTAVMFTVEHKSVERPIQQSFLLLNNLLKESGQFTFGFIDNQVMLNNVLTTETTLRALETEFLKRGIAAVTFEPGLTLGRSRGLATILDNDPPVSLSVDDPAAAEASGSLSFTVSLSKTSGQLITVNYATADGSATAPEDYAATTPGLTAHRPVNAIPYVVAAAPGIVTTVDLGQVIPRFS